MKESLAARQAALLKQNAELNERVEAIEQRRQQQLSIGASSSPSSLLQSSSQAAAFRLTSGPDMDNGEERDDDAFIRELEVVSAADYGGGGNRPSRVPKQMSLKMDLDASIDSFGSKLDTEEPHFEDPNQHDNGDVEPNNNTKTSKPRPPSRMKRQDSAESKFEKAEDLKSPNLIQNSNNANLRRAATPGAGATGDDIPEGLGMEATVRYQKARLRVLQDETDSANSHVKELQASQSVLKAQIDDLKAENGMWAKKCQQTQQLLDKQRELSAAQEAKQRILESQLAAAQAKAEEVQRSEKQASQQFRSKDVRLNRALEELEKVKSQLQDEKRVHDKEMITKSEFEQVVKENKKLEKQKSELLVAFKKQMKLIDLLKRQRIHMEAAKMLSFTEEEFSKTLELG